MNHKKFLIGLGIALAVILICVAIVMLGGNMLEMIRTHLGL
jgi:hypothetical protein